MRYEMFGCFSLLHASLIMFVIAVSKSHSRMGPFTLGAVQMQNNRWFLFRNSYNLIIADEETTQREGQ